MDKIDELLTRGVENIIPTKKALEDVLRSGKKLNIYLGIDPTATKIHIGHAVPLRKLQTFVELGHNVTFLIGDFTSLIGDTSDKDTERPVLTYEQIQDNFKTYKNQAEKILDFSKVKISHNGEWLKKLNFVEIIKLCQHFSAGDFVGRELIKKRLNDGKKVGLHELLYPVMQGYDSYFMDTDIQIGGTDQTFNMQAGRTLQKDLRNKDSFVLATGFLEGTDGRKMSKSWGNAVWIEDLPSEMFGKIMSLRDDLINQYFVLATNLSIKDIPTQGHPMELKKQLAHQIVMELHSKHDADKAQEEFENTFQKKEIGDVDEIQATSVEDLIKNNIVDSKSAWKRLVEQGAVERDGQKITEDNDLKQGVYRIGKKRFIKII